jgi:hypothetical protein
MKLAEIEREIAQLNAESRRKLMALLVSLEIREEHSIRSELTRRLDDKSEGGWMPLKEVKEKLSRLPSDE